VVHYLNSGRGPPDRFRVQYVPLYDIQGNSAKPGEIFLRKHQDPYRLAVRRELSDKSTTEVPCGTRDKYHL
jgi:hypothetical protein